MPVDYKVLALEQRAHFLERGYVRIEGGVPPEHIARFTSDVWVRLGYDPADEATWEKEKVRWHRC